MRHPVLIGLFLIVGCSTPAPEQKPAEPAAPTLPVPAACANTECAIFTIDDIRRFQMDAFKAGIIRGEEACTL